MNTYPGCNVAMDFSPRHLIHFSVSGFESEIGSGSEYGQVIVAFDWGGCSEPNTFFDFFSSDRLRSTHVSYSSVFLLRMLGSLNYLHKSRQFRYSSPGFQSCYSLLSLCRTALVVKYHQLCSHMSEFHDFILSWSPFLL